MPNTIVLKGSPQAQEAVSAVVITPGELLAWNATPALIPHGTASGNVAPIMVATEQELIGNDIDTDYASGDTVHYVVPESGAVLYMFLADGENVSQGDLLESDGNGDLQAHTPQAVNEGGAATVNIQSVAVVGTAAEDLNNSAGGARARIRVRIR